MENLMVLLVWLVIFTYVCFVIETADGVCQDIITKKEPLNIPIDSDKDVTITLCAALTRHYPILCRKNEHRKKCCQACKKLNFTELQCLDDFRIPETAKRNFEKFKNCHTFIKEDPCRCQTWDVRRHCCQSCKSVGRAALNCRCRDMFNPYLRPAYGIIYKVLYDNSTVHRFGFFRMVTLFNETFLSKCETFAQKFPFFCGPHNPVIRSKLCCKSCKHVDWRCVDNLLWRANITFRGNITCSNCTCHDMADTDLSMMRKACSEDIQGLNSPLGAREACCHQCKRLGFRKPWRYIADPKLLHTADYFFIPGHISISEQSQRVKN